MCSDDLNDCLECALCVACCYACCLCCCKDNKNQASVGNYPNSPAIISQPQNYGGGGGGYPQQDSSYGPYNNPYGQQQKDASGFGYNPNQIQGQGGFAGNPYPMGQFGQNVQYPQGYQGGPPPPYSYHQVPPAGMYFPPQANDYQHQQPYPPSSQIYPQTHNIPDQGKY